MKFNPYQVTEDFEVALAKYTNAPHVVCVNSCTNALFLVLAWQYEFNPGLAAITIPKRTYVGVAQSILNAGFYVEFSDDEWAGAYRLKPYDVWDYARWIYYGMYIAESMQCLSFQATKMLGIEAGGAILTDNEQAAKWFRKARHDGRTPGVPIEDDDIIRGWHCLMNPSSSAIGLLKLHSLPKDNALLPNDDYPDLSKIEAFK